MAEVFNNNLPELEVSQEDLAKQKEIKWTVIQTKKALNSPDINPFYKKNGEKYQYNLDTVKSYLSKLQNKTPDQLKSVNTAAWIMAVQIGLKALKYDIKIVDGLLATKGHFSGSETAKVIAQFQADNGLDTTGIPYGPTIKKILEKLGGAVSGAVHESTVNNQNATGRIKPNQLPVQATWKEKISSQKKITNEQFVSKVLIPFREDSDFKPEQIFAIENKLKNYLKNEDISKYQQFDSDKIANGKWYLSMDEDSELWIGTFKDGKLVDGIKVLSNGNVEEVKNTITTSEVLSVSQMFEQSPIGMTFEKLREPAAWLSNDLVQAWKKQAENYFKDKNPKEYKPFSLLSMANSKWYVYELDKKSLQIGNFEKGKLLEGILLKENTVSIFQSGSIVDTKVLFDNLTPQQENEQALKLQKRATLSEKITAIWSGKISSVKAGSEKSLKELAVGDRGDLKNLEKGLEELQTLISANQEFIMSDEGLRLELTNSLNDIKAGLESKNRGIFNGTNIKERLLKEVDGLISIFSSPEKIPDYNKEQDSLATRIWVGAQVKTESSSSSVQQKVEEVNINPNVDPIPNHSDLLSGSSTWTTETTGKKDQVNGVVPPQAETQTAQGKNQRELERQKQLAAEKAEKAKKEAEKKAKELAEQEKKAAEKRKQEEEKKKKLQEENEKKEAEKKANQESANKQQNKPSEKKETATASKEFTRDSKFEDLATLSGDASNLKFEFNKGVLQTDGNGKYILINGEKYYEYTDDENKQNPALKYFDLNRNHPKGIEIQFWGLDSGYVQPDFSFVPEK